MMSRPGVSRPSLVFLCVRCTLSQCIVYVDLCIATTRPVPHCAQRSIGLVIS